MKEKDKLDNKIKSSFDGLNKKAPDMLWSQLSDSLNADSADTFESQPGNDRLYHKVRDSFFSLNQKAPQHIWQSINRQLNIDLVWSRLNKELDHSPSVSWPVYRWAAVLLLLMLSFSGGYYVYRSQPQAAVADVTENNPDIAAPPAEKLLANEDSSLPDKEIKSPNSQHISKPAKAYEQAQEEASITKQEEESQATLPLQLAEGRQQKAPSSSGDPFQEKEENIWSGSRKDSQQSGKEPDKAYRTSAAAFAQNLPSEPKENKSTATYPEEETTGKAGSVSGIENDIAAKGNLWNAHIPYGVERLAMQNAGENENTFYIQPVALDSLALGQIAEAEEKVGIKLNNFSFGPVMAYNNSWLLNNETRNSFDKGSLISTSPTYKQDFGIAIHYLVNPKSTLATEFHLVSKTGQDYNTFSEGYYQKMGIELSYYKLYVQYQRTFFPYRRSLFSDITAKAGLYGGLLHRKKGEIRNTESTYSSFDYGLRFALGQEKRMNRLIIGYGLSGERGLTNIFMGSGEMPARFNKTYTLNIGPYLNFRYH